MVHGAQPYVTLASHLDAIAVFSILFQVYGATHVSYWGWNFLLREYPVSKVAPLSLLIPVFGLIGSTVILKQKINATGWIAVGLIMSSLAIGLIKSRVLFARHRDT